MTKIKQGLGASAYIDICILEEYMADVTLKYTRYFWLAEH